MGPGSGLLSGRDGNLIQGFLALLLGVFGSVPGGVGPIFGFACIIDYLMGGNINTQPGLGVGSKLLSLIPPFYPTLGGFARGSWANFSTPTRMFKVIPKRMKSYSTAMLRN